MPPARADARVTTSDVDLELNGPMPPHHPRRFSRAFHLERRILLAVLAIVEHPVRSLIVAGIILVACATGAMLRLNISSDQDKLFSPNVKFFQDYLEFDRKFPENEAVYVVVEARNPARPSRVARWTALADAIAQRVRQVKPYVTAVDAHVPLDKLGAQGLLFDEPAAVRQSFEDVKRFVPLARLWGEENGSLPGGAAGAVVGRLLGRTPLERFITAVNLAGPSSDSVFLLDSVAASWDKTLRDPAEPVRVGENVPDLKTVAAETPRDLGYYYESDQTDKSKSLLLVRVYPKANYDSLDSITQAVGAIRAAVNAAARPFAAEFNVGVTGRPALDADEMETTDRDSNRSEIIAAIAVFIGLVVMLRSLWLALAAEICLGVGICWTFGWATISVGELNLLSIVFLIALIGIGMDYLVQILTRYRSESRRHARPKAIWLRVFRHVAAPINTACLGAAGAFLVSVFTDFRGAADLGIIAGGGLLLCLLSGYTVLPAMLTLFPGKFAKVDVALRNVEPPPARGPVRLLLPVIWIVALAAIAPSIPQAHFNSNLLDLQAPNLESTKLIRKLQTWSSVVLTKDRAVLRQARQAVEDLPSVASTESILSAEDNYRWLHEHDSELPPIRWSTPSPIEPRDLATLANKARALADRIVSLAPIATTRPAAASQPSAIAAQAAQWSRTAQSLRRFADQLGAANPGQAAQRLSAWQDTFVTELHQLIEQFSPAPLDLSKVPPELRSHLVSDDGTYALYIYPKHDLWNRERMKAFVDQVEGRINKLPNPPTITGIVQNIFHTTRAIRTSFIRATTYALALIVVLVFIDLRNVRHTLLAISVLAMGLPMLVGLMGLIGVDWNFANFFGLPILIGAGHEYGVFLVHRYREARRDPRRVWKSWDVADRALLLCAYVTCSSFAFFWALGHHRGLKSLGLVMAVGTACIYLSAILVLRPLLKWLLERRSRSGRS
jgi:hypothetical protein